ncbi:hypothetical protein Taro_056550 [Colocasia esculenta]|uniref:Pectinesterase n=1 Tax=Colocasia esculenta TaxID=4460 RepID=A0A843XW38_COLES|nr:hypothetical protein [Colocasia esculenta]
MAKLWAVLGLVSLCITTLNVVVNGAPITSCSQTPYPEVCYSLAADATPQVAEEKTRLGFGDFTLRGAMVRAQRAHQLASAVDMASLDGRARAAWADCMELSEGTIRSLNRSMGSSGQPSDEDIQTWLSAAIANQQTCQDGFKELNQATSVTALPFASDNISELLSNSLAVAKSNAVSKLQGGGSRRLLSKEKGYPSWVSAADRKLLQSASVNADLVVAKDGSGHYKTISEALAASTKLRSGAKRFVIRVKAGIYKENVDIPKSMKNLILVGDGIDATVVTGSRNVVDGSTTFRSATFAVTGDGFIARDMTFENTAGPQKYQAVALRSGSDLSVFYRCSFKGYQDTLYVQSQRQFYRECDIYGTVDFIFGDSVAVLQNCNMYVRRPMSNQKNTVTAQGRTDPNENTGISIHNSKVTSASDLKPVQGSFKTYLGRPWKQYSRTVFMKSTLDNLVDPAGWLEWSGNFALSTLYYGEHMNTGAGAGTSGRVKWPGFRVITSVSEASKFTVGNFLSGSSWIPGTGVPFTAGL